ncbi:MAG: OsmC family protein [Myxococcota bacterium]
MTIQSSHARIHTYKATVSWTGNRGTGTSSIGAYGREHEIRCPGRPVIYGTSDPAFRGDPTKHNPEDLLVAALSGCHMLWFLSLCADAGIVVVSYTDDAVGVMEEQEDGAGQFESVTLHPKVALAIGSDVERAMTLHKAAHEMCFIARSVAFPVRHVAKIGVAQPR